MRRLNLVGQRFGRLIVMADLGTKDGRTYSLCHCDCGNDIEVCNKMLKNGHVQSCGCLKRDNASKMGKRTWKYNVKFAQEKAKEANKIHGHSKTRLYRIWCSMKQRCSNPKNFSYNYYGEKGIFVCEEWHDYLNFEKWAIESGYSDNLTIDRINPSEGYNPNNCRWVTLPQNSKRAGETDRRYWALNENIGLYAEFGNLTEFLNVNNINVSYTQAQDIIRGKVKSKNGWVFGKE